MLKNFIIKEFSHWHILEVCWLVFCSLFTVGLSLYLGDTALGISAALTGVLYSLFAGKGKISCYLLGIYNSAAYGWISFEAALYGEVLLNWCWYLPMMFAGVFFWKKHLKKDVQEIIKQRLSFRERLVWAAALVLAVSAGALVLDRLSDPMPVIDSLTTVLSFAAMILTVKRCVEQWFLWTVVNAASIYMWYRLYLAGEGSVAVLLMWLLALVNGVIFYCLWQRELKRCQKTN